MAKTVIPMLSIKAKGQIGKSLVFADWRGINYGRSYVVPANPKTTEQMKTRDVFSYLTDYWRMAGTEARAPWKEFVKGKPLTDRNALLKNNIPGMRTDTDLADFQASPGTSSAPTLKSLTAAATANAGELKCTATLNDMPAGWTFVKVVFVVVREQDPHLALAETPKELTDNTSPYEVTFTGLTPAQMYRCLAWAVYTTASGVTAYGASISATGTPA